MSPTPPHRDPTRTAAEAAGEEARPPGDGDASTDARAADAATATSDPAATATDGPAPAATDGSAGTAAGVTRRGLVRSIGTGAALLGGATALSGASAGQSSEPGEVQIEGVEDWEVTTERVDQSEVPDGPTVAFEDDAIVVTGGHVFSRTGCDTFAPRRLVHSPETSRLGVVVDAVPTDTEASRDDPQVCADALMPLVYELRVTTEEHTSDVVVEEAFTDDGRSHHPRIDDGGIDPPPEVADYDFAFGPEVGPDTAEVLTPSDADAMRPSVTFDGDDVIVEGAMTYGSSTCDEIALDYVQRRYEVEGHVEVELDAQREETVMPGDGCTLDLAAEYYRLELTGSGEPPIERCSVRENPPNEVQSVMVEEADDDLEYPDGVVDHRLELDRSGDADDREAEPTVSYVVGDEPAVVVEGTMGSGSSSCGTIGVGELAVDEEHTSILSARLDRTDRENDLAACTDDGVTVDYRLELTVEEFPDGVAAAEGVDGVEDPERRVIVDFYGGVSELPEGVLEYALSTEGVADAEDVHADPGVSADASAEPPVVTVEGALSVSACYATAVTDVRWEDDAQNHLAVTVTTVDGQGQPATHDDCPLEALPLRTYYTVDLAVESLPGTVTAEERIGADGEPERSATVQLGDGEPCTDGANTETVDGQVVCDVNDDGDYRDVNGDGSVGQGDVAEFFTKQHRSAWKQPELFDFSGNDAVTHGDVVELFDYVALQ